MEGGLEVKKVLVVLCLLCYVIQLTRKVAPHLQETFYGGVSS